MKLLELCETIHGELPHIGYPVTLVRFKDCNLACDYCDADLTGMPTQMSHKELFRLIAAKGQKHVLITGGEPLLEPHIYDLLHLLDSFDYTTVVETNGSLPITRGPWPNVTFNMDVKFFDPKAVEQAILNLDNLGDGDCLKFVYANESDWAMIENIMNVLPVDFSASIVFSPATGTPANIDRFLAMCKAYPYDMRMQTQIHKVLGAA